MTKNDIIATAEALAKEHCLSILSAEDAELLNAKEFCFFDAPLVGVADAEDSWFRLLKAPQAVGEHYITPSEWLNGAKSVISIFVPYSKAVKKANAALPKDKIAPEYVYAKNYVVPFIDLLVAKLADGIKAEGYNVVVPSNEAERMKDAVVCADGTRLKFTSGWSERHAAFACGLGTFGISGALITEKGTAGRYISLVTDMPLEADTRNYAQPYEYCTFCGACTVKCPAGAITVENKKDKAKCSAFVNSTKEIFAPFYGCAKCQCGVPCADGVPKR